MPDLVPIRLALFDRLARSVDVDMVLRCAKLPHSRFRVARPQGTTAELFALWRAVEQNGAEPDLGLRLGVETPANHAGEVARASQCRSRRVAREASLHQGPLGGPQETTARREVDMMASFAQWASARGAN
jgi:hypothetical protein